MFDTLKYAKRLEASGLTRDQAEVQVNTIAEMIVDGVATKHDLGVLRSEIGLFRSELKDDIAALRAELKEDMATLRAESKENITSLRADVQKEFHSQTVRMGVMFVANTTLILTVFALFK